MASANRRYDRTRGVTDPSLHAQVDRNSGKFALRLVNGNSTDLPDGTVAAQSLPSAVRRRNAAAAAAQAAFVQANSTPVETGLHTQPSPFPYMDTLRAIAANEAAIGYQGPMPLEEAMPSMAARGAELHVFPDARIPTALINQAPIN